MSDSWFDDVDIDDIPDNPNVLPNNTYKFRVISAKLGPTRDESKVGITFKYQIVEGAFSTFFPLIDWIQVPDGNTKREDKTRMLSYLKMRLLAWGFTTDEIKAFKPGYELKTVNRVFFGTTFVQKGKNGNTDNIKVQKFDPIDGGSGSDLVDFPEV